MASLAVKSRAMSVYVVNVEDEDKLMMEISKGTKNLFVGSSSSIGERKKLTPRRAHKDNVDYAPNAEHRHCARHLYANWNKTFKGEEMKLLFWRCAKAYNEADFSEAIEEMEKVNSLAVESFKKLDAHLFCRAFVKVESKCDVILSNMVETFNNYIMQARSKHLIDMLEDIRTLLMKRIALKKEDALKKWKGLLCPRVQALLEKEKEEASNCTLMPSTSTLFQVSHYIDVLEVDIVKKTCTCKKWDLRGIPCCHAVACISYLHMNVESFVDNSYTKEAYLRAYGGSINPVTGERHWPKVVLEIDPPPIKIGPGRPRKNRIKCPHENPKKPGRLTRHGLLMTCAICKSPGHNKRKCPDKGKMIEQNPSKRKRGRPRKTVEEGHTSTTTSHHEMTAQPSALGRGNRTIKTGKGSRGGMTSAEGSKKRGKACKLSQRQVDVNSTQASTSIP